MAPLLPRPPRRRSSCRSWAAIPTAMSRLRRAWTRACSFGPACSCVPVVTSGAAAASAGGSLARIGEMACCTRAPSRRSPPCSYPSGRHAQRSAPHVHHDDRSGIHQGVRRSLYVA
eukprot:scaffold5637_cov350-Prasinococcus_capsulatus_cf.AAC.6